ncbi:MAG: hypothetical protein K8T91_14240 [Planctomycetes bacterium]|nr:hypothetical protein [Planctomycetota bacterium]
MLTLRSTVMSFFLLLLTVGCERPPVPAPTQESGPPKVVIVELKSDQGKELLAARKKHHENFVTEKTELPSTTAEAPAAVASPAAPVGTSAAPGQAPSQPFAPANVPAAEPAAPGTPPMTPAQFPATGVTPAGPPASAPTVPVVAPTGTPPAGIPHVAAADIAGRKGKEYGSGLIATPIGAYFGTRERVAMMQITEQLKLWSTQHERAPRDYKEFTEVIVKPTGIKLPELRPGERYNFYPKEGPHGTLVVEQPAAVPKK